MEIAGRFLGWLLKIMDLLPELVATDYGAVFYFDIQSGHCLFVYSVSQYVQRGTGANLKRASIGQFGGNLYSKMNHNCNGLYLTELKQTTK